MLLPTQQGSHTLNVKLSNWLLMRQSSCLGNATLMVCPSFCVLQKRAPTAAAPHRIAQDSTTSRADALGMPTVCLLAARQLSRCRNMRAVLLLLTSAQGKAWQ